MHADVSQEQFDEWLQFDFNSRLCNISNKCERPMFGKNVRRWSAKLD
jgi:hypothetical protein